jgi:hypothetical protein
VTGTGGYHFISGDLGNDTIDLHTATSASLNDTVYGGGGDDTILGSLGTGNQLYGQTGNDTITLYGQGSVYGGQGNDLITDGTVHANGSFFSGDLGDDSIFASGINDTLYGGDGNDSLLAHGGNDQLYGQAGNDILLFDAGSGTATAATIYGGAGDDYISVDFATILATGGPHTLNSGSSSVAYDPYTHGAIAGNNSDVVTYSHAMANDGVGFHFLSGDLGNDTIMGGSGGDTFVGGAGTDQLYSHRLTATGNDPSAYGYAANGAGDAADTGSTDGVPTDPGANTTGAAGHSPTVTVASTVDADVFVFHANDSVGTSPVAPGTGSDISTGGGEAGIDHVHGFLLNVTGQEAIFPNGTGDATQSFINSQAGDDLVFLTGTHTTYFSGTAATDATLDTNVFYGTATNAITGASTATEQSDYAVAYSYAFGTGGTAAAPTASAAFANGVDFIVVDVKDTGTGVTNNGNIFVFDHNGNAVALDGAGLSSAGTNGTFENSASPAGGVVSGNDALGHAESTTTVNIYH